VNRSVVNTIGFTKTDARRFFERLLSAGVKKVIDVRLHNTSQLAGFAKADDLKYFLSKIGDIQYVHYPLLAPTDDILKAFKKDKGDWSEYEARFLSLMASRKIEDRLTPESLDETCLLCSEASPHHCHRRLLVDYLNGRWGGALRVRHL
jgi:uncharacterized protein (DUF488 family)